MNDSIDQTERERCLICISVVTSGSGTYPFTCANGHTLYRGGGATVDWSQGGRWVVGSYSYRLPTRREVVDMWARRWWPNYPRVALGGALA